MSIFKSEQMYMVEEYINLKDKDRKRQGEVSRIYRRMASQERIISEMRAFIHDCLD